MQEVGMSIPGRRSIEISTTNWNVNFRKKLELQNSFLSAVTNHGENIEAGLIVFARMWRLARVGEGVFEAQVHTHPVLHHLRMI